jgi:DUF1680 family protein
VAGVDAAIISRADTSATTVIESAGRVALSFRMPDARRVDRRQRRDSGATCTPGMSDNRTHVAERHRVTVCIPLTLRMEPVDRHHPDRVAVVRGPVVLVLEAPYHDPNFRLPERDDDLATWLVPEPWTPATAYHGLVHRPPADTMPTIFRVVPPDKRPVRLKFRPFFEVGEAYPYFMYSIANRCRGDCGRPNPPPHRLARHDRGRDAHRPRCESSGLDYSGAGWQCPRCGIRRETLPAD